MPATEREGVRGAHRPPAQRDPAAAVRAGLEEGLRRLGPVGRPFEILVARLLSADGFRTTISARRRGRLVEHEIDVLAERPGRVLFCECKLRTKPRSPIALPVALAAYGRAVDLDAVGDGPNQTWLVTNARFTADARTFARGMGIQLLGWGEPEEGGLERAIEESGLFPITALPHLPRSVARTLLVAGIVDTSQLLAAPDAIEMPARQAAHVLAEAASVVPAGGSS
ncbi:MAG: restriction endonuclease [Planctomycetota bacterium]|nr:restriction endonuclease [Planctomycetota bacterium]